MNAPANYHQRNLLQRIAHQAMIDRGLQPDFSSDAVNELNLIQEVKADPWGDTRDLRSLIFCSIDNDDSRDLDQLTVAVPANNGATRILVAIADVDVVVKKNSPLDKHASYNTTSVYTAAEIFPMLPEKLSTGITSLNFQEDRYAVVTDMVINADGTQGGAEIYRAVVRNFAKLAYNSVADWLDGTGDEPEPIKAVRGLDENLRLQDQVAQKLKAIRFAQGALDFETIEARAVFEGDQIRDLQADVKNRAKTIIEDFMIAANGIVAKWLASKKLPSVRRIVRVPKRWSRIVELAAELKYSLPAQPDSKALEEFLLTQKKAHPETFPDLSLSVIKLLGSGQYSIVMPGEESVGHFGLAVKDYAHTTAPNRRFPDLITQRLVKAALSGQPVPYEETELVGLAAHCTEQEDNAKKVERQVEKSAAALLLQHRIGQQFDAIVTGASEKGVWVRLMQMPVEGKLVSGAEGVDVGRRLQVQLVSTDVFHGFIDFRRVR
ncbi:MAG TPA: RNB domain-containing ribonuclease [Puia sp.]|nr:RNB domain-containing ribonuclease [Puia sp.]